MSKKLVSEILKDFGLNDEQILTVAIQDTLGGGVTKLKEFMAAKWNMSTIDAMQTVKKLKEEFNQ